MCFSMFVFAGILLCYRVFTSRKKKSPRIQTFICILRYLTFYNELWIGRF